MVVDMELFIELVDILVLEWATVINNDQLRDTIPTNDVIENEC